MVTPLSGLREITADDTGRSRLAMCSLAALAGLFRIGRGTNGPFLEESL